MKNKNSFLAKLAIPYLIFMTIFIILPMILVFIYSITLPSNEVFSIKFTFNHFIKFFVNQQYVIGLLSSIKLAFYSTIFCFIIGYPVAYILAKTSSRKRNIFLLLIVVPMWTNMLLRTYAWRFIISRNGLLNQFLELLHLPQLDIMNSGISVAIGMTYNYLPFMILPIFSVLIKLDKDLIYAAYDLGANKFKTFLKIVFPLSLPGVITGITMVFLPATTSFIIPAYLGGGKEDLIGIIIERQFKGIDFNANFGSAMSIILMVLIFGFVYLLTFNSKDGERGESLW